MKFPMKMSALCGFLVGFAAAVTTSSCSDEARDCGYVCDRYQECISSSFDVGACKSRCQMKAGDRDFDDRLEHCAACLEGRSCSEATSKCIAQCLGIVP